MVEPVWKIEFIIKLNTHSDFPPWNTYPKEMRALFPQDACRRAFAEASTVVVALNSSNSIRKRMAKQTVADTGNRKSAQY